MCLAVPGKVVERNGMKAVLEYDGERREADCTLVDVNVGDYVLVSNGMVIEKLDKKEAEESLGMYRDALN